MICTATFGNGARMVVMRTIRAYLTMGVYGHLAMKRGCFAVVRGATFGGVAVRLLVAATIPIPATGTAATASGLSAPLGEFFLPSALLPFTLLNFILSRLAAVIFLFLRRADNDC